MTTEKELQSVGMAAMEKVAWTELLVSTTAIIIVLILLPVLGHQASSAFAILGAIVCSFWFIRERKKRTVVDERDLEVERQSQRRGLEAAWMFLVLSLIAIVLWPRSNEHTEFLTRTMLNWLIWIQFAIYVGVKGFVGVILYRRQTRVS